MAFLKANILFVTLSIICVVFVATLVVVSSNRSLSPLESILLQVLALGTGVWASYLFSQQSAAKAAREMMKPYARSAFRRATNLYFGLTFIMELIGQNKGESEQTSRHLVDLIEVAVNQQLYTASDALEDWRDIVPEEVADLESRFERQRKVDEEGHRQ